jgi:hypothetical protein
MLERQFVSTYTVQNFFIVLKLAKLALYLISSSNFFRI